MPEDAQKSIVKKLIWKYKQLPRNKQIIYCCRVFLNIYVDGFRRTTEESRWQKTREEKIVDGKVVKEGEADPRNYKLIEQLFNALSPEDQRLLFQHTNWALSLYVQNEDALKLIKFKNIPKYKDKIIDWVASSTELEELEKTLRN